MPKVRITQAPKGATGSQSNYGLVRKTNVSTTNKADRDVKNTMTALKGEDVEKANIEVEGGETVLGDINKDGHLELFEFKGKRHSQGGMPVDIPEGAFIFSDTPKLKIKDKKMLKEYFGLNSKKGGYTPAEISKKYQINKFMDILKDPESDEMAKRSANEMVKKNMQKLGILAFIQELQKGVPDGIPDISMMAFSELGLDPNQLLQEAMPQQPQQGMMPPQQMPMAKYGRQLKYPDGGNTPSDVQSKQVFDDYYHYLYDRLNQVYGQDFLESKPPGVDQGAYDLVSNLLVWKDDRKIPNDPEMMSMVEAIKSADILPDDEIKTILSYDISKKLGMFDKASLWASLSGDTLEKFQEFRDYVKGAREEGFTFRDGGESVPKLRFKKGTVPFNLVQRDGGKIPDDVLRSRLESHMSPSEASAYLDSYKKGGYTVTRSNDRKGKTHKVVRNSDGKTEYYGYPGMGEKSKSKYGKDAFYARHAKNIKNNPFFAAYARATWAEEGGEMDMYKKGGRKMVKRADGSYSPWGLWDSIRAKAKKNKAAGKKGKEPTEEMRRQADLIRKAEYGEEVNPYAGRSYHINETGDGDAKYYATFGDKMRNFLKMKPRIGGVRFEYGGINSLAKFVGGGELPMYQNAGLVNEDFKKSHDITELAGGYDSWEELEDDYYKYVNTDNVKYADGLRLSVDALRLIDKGDYAGAIRLAEEIDSLDVLNSWDWIPWSEQDTLSDMSGNIISRAKNKAKFAMFEQKDELKNDVEKLANELTESIRKSYESGDLKGMDRDEMLDNLEVINGFKNNVEYSTFNQASSFLNKVKEMMPNKNLSKYNALMSLEPESGYYTGQTDPVWTTDLFETDYTPYFDLSQSTTNLITYQDKQYKLGDNGAWLINVGKGDRPSWSKVTDKNIIDALNKRSGRSSTTTVKSNTTVNGGGNGGNNSSIQYFNPADLKRKR